MLICLQDTSRVLQNITSLSYDNHHLELPNGRRDEIREGKIGLCGIRGVVNNKLRLFVSLKNPLICFRLL
jgi:hypothetical protein